MLELEEDVYDLRWNNNMAVIMITLVSYDYMLQFEKEVTNSLLSIGRILMIIFSQVKYVWERQRSLMSYLYLAVSSTQAAKVRYFGFFLAMICACWGGLLYIPEALLRHYSFNTVGSFCIFLLGGSRPSAFSGEFLLASNFVQANDSLHSEIVILMEHLKEQRELKRKPNTYVLMIVRYHIMYFVLNLTSQIFSAILWANLPMSVLNLVLLFNDTAPFIIAPRLIVSIWDEHANDNVSVGRVLIVMSKGAVTNTCTWFLYDYL
ncbi:hypothetical protein DFH29DRAFT_876344 [Suillus ampliporus]|nr:hypothetical protein DFH29DRAFT_876344 [Suillus ampliporus]